MTTPVENERMWLYRILVFIGVPGGIRDFFLPKLDHEGTIASRTLVAGGRQIKYGPGHKKEVE